MWLLTILIVSYVVLGGLVPTRIPTLVLSLVLVLAPVGMGAI